MAADVGRIIRCFTFSFSARAVTAVPPGGVGHTSRSPLRVCSVTVAVCIECGSIKHGALNPCHHCGFTPEDNESKAKSMVVTDHFLSKSDLDGIGDRIRNGLPVTYPQDAIDDYIKMFEENPNMEAEAGRFILGCFAVVALIVVAIIVGVWYFAN